SATQFANAGTYEYTVSFTHENGNYNEITKTYSAVLTIEQADYPGADGIEFNNQSTSLGLTLTAEAKNVPDGVTVTYVYGGEEQSEPFVFSELNLEGYVVIAKFTHSDPNYKPIGDKEATFVIGAKPTYNESGLSFVATGATGSGTEFTATYNPNVTVKIELTGSVTDQSGASVAVAVEYTYKMKVDGEWVEVTADDLKKAGTYQITAAISTGNDLYDVIEDRTVTLTIEKAEADLSGVSFDDVTVTYDGELHTIVLKGTLPDYVTVEYLIEGEEFTGAVDMGTYEVVARFTVDTELYIQPEEMTAVLKIDAKAYELTGITFENATFVYDGEAHSIYISGIELPDWITVSYTGNEVTGVGTHTVTAKFSHNNENYSAIADMTAQIIITKAKVALPVYNGTLSYTGDELKPTADDFEGFDSALMAFVESKTVAGLNAGAYKAVFALKDGDCYEWATATTLKKSLLVVAVYDGALVDNEAAVEWTLAKAKISAVSGADGKPVFKSEGISAAALAQAVSLKFYADEACTQEIVADKLAYETTYYMQVELLDKTNFELDKSVADAVKAPYTTPAKELSTGEKIVNILKTYWLYIVIALVVLVVLILAIVLGTRSAKRKREREERKEEERLAREERKEEERRQREEDRRREEREERMSRMSQPQMQMPQIMPQMMPQMMGQMMGQQMGQQMQAPQSQPAVQTMAAGGSMDSAQMARIENELAAIRAEQNAAKEIASIKADAAQQISAAKLEAEIARLRVDMSGGAAHQISGVSAGMSYEALAEVITVALKNAFGSERPQAVAVQPAQPAQMADGGATAQVPPDAVMTTVTTTKIDTTKKQAQNAAAQPAPAGRTVVRNFVAPMPVDDGRVFDVGGFYTPVDPVTDDIDNMLGDEKK
ncbi:MAG: hypothetical protein K2G26_02680, partial [Clostridia bacterium]|nr:hypothetical protein [Clostridia bacterium]